MHIERLYFKERYDESPINLSDFSSEQYFMPELTEAEEASSNASLQKVIEAAKAFEREHPRIKSDSCALQFKRLCLAALDMAQTLSMDIRISTDSMLQGHISISCSMFLLQRDYFIDYLPLMKQLMNVCEQFCAAPVEAYNQPMIEMSFIIPLYEPLGARLIDYIRKPAQE